VLRQYERGVVFLLGKFEGVRGPGLTLIFIPIQQMVRVSLRTVTMQIPSQKIITKDNVSLDIAAEIAKERRERGARQSGSVSVATHTLSLRTKSSAKLLLILLEPASGRELHIPRREPRTTWRDQTVI
jgi:hypothetical protein